jgi:hypothetical protein
MNWRVIPIQQEPQRAWVIALVAGLVVFLAILLTKQPLVAMIGVVVIAASTAEFWLGTTYILDEEKAFAKIAFSGSEIKWDDVKSVNIDQSHIYLSPFADETRLSGFRGVKLNLTNADRDQVIEYVREQAGEDVRFLGG